jgi:hypothetical protein
MPTQIVNAPTAITQRLDAIEDAITRLLNGESVVSIASTLPDGSVERVEYSAANLNELIALKDHYVNQQPRHTLRFIEVELVL